MGFVSVGLVETMEGHNDSYDTIFVFLLLILLSFLFVNGYVWLDFSEKREKNQTEIRISAISLEIHDFRPKSLISTEIVQNQDHIVIMHVSFRLHGIKENFGHFSSNETTLFISKYPYNGLKGGWITSTNKP